MTTVGVPCPVSPERVRQHATRLRERILAGECPYPDAMLEANERFLSHLPAGDEAEASLESASRLERLGTALCIGGAASAAAVLVFAIACPPLAANAVVAAAGAMGSGAMIDLGRRMRASGRESREFASQMDAWSRYDSDAPPPARRWQGLMTVGGLKSLTSRFPDDIESFPYAASIKAEHERFMASMPEDDRAVAEVKADLVSRAQRPGSGSSALLTGACSVLGSASWIAGTSALASGHPIVAAGLLAGLIASTALRAHAGRKTDLALEAARSARSLHFWETVMAQAPPPTPETVVFGSPPPPKDVGTIARSHEDVRIGNVVVPVKPQARPAAKP